MKTKFLVILILTAIIPSMVFAQTDTSALILSLQKQVLELLKQIQTLQQEVGALKSEAGFQTPSPSPISPLSPISPVSPLSDKAELPELNRPLSLGSRGDDVRKLQEFLARDRNTYPEGLTTGYYGPKTAEAVKRWQRKQGIESVGIVGPKTIAKFRELGQGVVRGLIEQGAGRSGMIPPGLLTAPGIQPPSGASLAKGGRQMATATPTVMFPVMATVTPPVMTTTTPAIPAEPATPATPATPGTTSAVPATPATPATPSTASTSSPQASTSNELKVTYPNGGETWYKGNSYAITWQNPLAGGFSGQEKYYWNVLLKRGNTAWQADGGVPVTQSSYTWSKWTGWPEPIPNANDFKVGISLVDTCAVQVGGSCPSANISIAPAGGIDYSDGYFTATSTPTTTTSTSDTIAPSTPTNLTTAVISSTQIRLSWTASTDNVRVAGYKVYRDGAYVKSVTLALDVAPNSPVDTFYYDYPLSPLTTYTYTVAAYDAAGNVSGQSISTTATTPTLSIPQSLSPPNTASIKIEGMSGTLNYNITVQDSAGIYHVQINKWQDAASASGLLLSQVANCQTQVSTGYRTLTQSEFPIIAHVINCANRTGENTGYEYNLYGYYSSVTILSTPTLPAAPTSLFVSGSSPTSIGLYWADNSTNESEFRIERRLNGGSWSQVGSVVGNITTKATTNVNTFYTDSNLSGAGTYDYRVKACNSVGCSVESNIISRTIDAEAPAAPSGLTASASASSIAVGWTDNSTGEWGFRLKRRVQGSTSWFGLASVFNNSTGNSVSYTDSYQLTPNTIYEYVVRSYNTYESADSNLVTVNFGGTSSIDASPPSAPTGVVATAVSSSQINLSWNASTDNVGVTAYQVFRNGLFWYQTPNLSAQDTGLSPNTSYSYYVRALDAALYTSSPSVTVSATTPNGTTTTTTATTTSTILDSLSGLLQKLKELLRKR